MGDTRIARDASRPSSVVAAGVVNQPSPPANADMVEGYMDGRNLDTPKPSANRSYSYRHGFAVGRAEKDGDKLGFFQDVETAAQLAMAADESH